MLSDTRLDRDEEADAVPSRSHSFDAGAAASLPASLQPHEGPTPRRALDELAFSGPFPA
ncbi:hypothetical protein [Ralstonia pseudosolanacearum]|uniref:hypothetical protein n=1 Tax=Ralstonia pseudosolanacearum TaxID=1310165 RepID=UPI001FF9D25E|nr:hypothetical protein [Ralstonia pseudosolanacearum]